MTFNVALSGLRAASKDIEVTGNNIANASTVGFKRSRTEFGDVYANSFFGGGNANAGDGVSVTAARQLHTQGNVSFTDRGLDIAISGQGYFVLSDNGEEKFTRAGQFGIDREGFMVNNSGMRVQGFQADDEGNVSGVLDDLVIPTGDIEPQHTTDVELELNLDASEDVLSQRGTTLSTDGTNIGVATLGTTNGYPSQTIDVVVLDDASGNQTTTFSTTANASAAEIAAEFSANDGVQATARTTATIQQAAFNNASGLMTVSVNGISFQPEGATVPEQLADLGVKINSSALIGVTAVIDTSGNLQVIQDRGDDLSFSFAGDPGDSFAIGGSNDPVTTVTLNEIAPQGVVGGIIEISLDEGVDLEENPPGGATPIVANFLGTPFVTNPFSVDDASSYNHSTSSTIYDSLGNPHVLTMYFIKQQQSTTVQPNTWQMIVKVDGQDVGDPLIGDEPSELNVNIVFNEDGSINPLLSANEGEVLISNWLPLDSAGEDIGALEPLNVIDGGSLPIPNPSTNSNFAIDLNAITQYGSEFAVSNLVQNGFTTGRLVGLEIDDSGIMLSRFSNGESRVIGQMALANFRDVESLAPDGDTAWVETFDSGEPVIGNPGTASLGLLTSSAIEQSNVDLSNELVQLIIAQRNYQANSKTIETSDTIQQTILNI